MVTKAKQKALFTCPAPESEQWHPFTCTVLWSYLLDHAFSFQWHCGCVRWSLSMHKALLAISHYQHKTFSSYCAPENALSVCFLIIPSSRPQVSCAQPCQSWMNCSYPARCQCISECVSAMPAALVPLPAHLKKCAFSFTGFCIYFHQLTID